MRILIVVHGYPPTFTGGAELRAERTARALVARGHEVAVLCIESLIAPATRLVAPSLQDGVLVNRLFVQDGVAAAGRQLEHGAVAGAVEQMIASWRPELVHLFSGYLMGGNVIDKAVDSDLPVVVSLTDYWWLCHRINLLRTNGTRCAGPTPLDCARCANELYRRFRLPGNLARPLVDALWLIAGQVPALAAPLGVDEQAERLRALLKALSRATALISPSNFLAQTYMAYGVDAGLIRVWRQGVNMGLCPLRVPSSSVRFGYFGQIKHHKGVHTLLDAWARLKSEGRRSLAIYGSDHGEAGYGARLRERSRGFEGLSWRQPIGHSAVWQALAEIDVLVVPSRWNENSPNVILEAQAMGVVVVGSNLGGVAELVRHGENGLVFTPDDPADLSVQLSRLLDEPALLPALRRSPIPFKSFEAELDQIEGLYADLVARPVSDALVAEAISR